ncbi:MAG TPA: hypothetical protein VLK53_05215 [Gaiellaceae bacterium]|nr:hypothetical protein [Gaiellaceae bacterium]
MRTGVLLAVLAASASAADRPPFARSYAGTATGTLRANGRVDTWTVEGLTFTLQNARLARGRWGGTYLVTGGRVTFSSSGGSCTAKGSFSLGHLSWDAASISFLQNLRSTGYAYRPGWREHPVASSPDCTDISPGGGLWLLTDIDEHLIPGKRLSGHRTESSHGATRTWTWNLVPR